MHFLFRCLYKIDAVCFLVAQISCNNYEHFIFVVIVVKSNIVFVVVL